MATDTRSQSEKAGSPSAFRQLWNFVLHLRMHYQLFILSGGFLLGGFLNGQMNWPLYLFQFANVHIFLFGGATAYNSYWDKDTGPIGGLKNPPQMNRWMWFVAILMQSIGLLLAIPAGALFVGCYTVSMLLFWLYSTPLARWKATPVKSLVAIGVSTGTNSLLMGYLAAGASSLPWHIWLAAVGVALVILSLYPVSQIYQMEEDRRRGDQTFAVRYGIRAVFRFFEVAFFSGVVLISAAIFFEHVRLAIAFLAIGAVTGIVVRREFSSLTAQPGDYARVMKIKFATSFSFVLFLVGAILAKHTDILQFLASG